MQVKIGMRFHRADNLFRYKQITVYACVKQIMCERILFDESASVEYIIYKKLRNSNESTLSFIPHACYFSYRPWIASSEDQSLLTLFITKFRGKETVTRALISLPQTLNWPKHFIRWGCFEICCGNI